jgi:membrane-bound lytic murein transglycosylase B
VTLHRLVPAAVVVLLVLALGATGILMRPHGTAWHAPHSATQVDFAAARPPSRTVPAKTTSRPVADPTWVSRTSAETGLPSTAVAAYGDAALRLAAEQPSCRLGWTTLAGIGTVESANGTIGGRTLLSSGYSDTAITGPALNGIGYAAIKDSGRWARALGPMQFLASTWTRWGADGDNDGTADVDDIFDAALAAGRYLCADGHDLGTADGWAAAIRSYNHSDVYVHEVYENAVAAGNAAP